MGLNLLPSNTFELVRYVGDFIHTKIILGFSYINQLCKKTGGFSINLECIPENIFPCRCIIQYFTPIYLMGVCFGLTHPKNIFIQLSIFLLMLWNKLVSSKLSINCTIFILQLTFTMKLFLYTNIWNSFYN